MRKALIVIDMQNDFIDGPLGTWEAKELVDRIGEYLSEFSGEVYFTRDTHTSAYLSTREGRKLPVEHCIKDSRGWQIHEKLPTENAVIFDKETFGSKTLARYLEKENAKTPFDEIILVGVCTDICVISNALLIKSVLPECEITVDASLCAGVTPQSHLIALEAMKACQINVIRNCDL